MQGGSSMFYNVLIMGLPNNEDDYLLLPSKTKHDLRTMIKTVTFMVPDTENKFSLYRLTLSFPSTRVCTLKINPFYDVRNDANCLRDFFLLRLKVISRTRQTTFGDE